MTTQDVTPVTDLAAPMESDATRFSLTLSRDPANGEISVLSAELMGDGFKQRATFPGRMDIRDVLNSEMVNFVVQLLERPGGSQAQVVSLPEARAKIHGLMLGRVRIFFRAVVENYDSAVLRFADVKGDLNAAFRVGVFFIDGRQADADDILTDTLEHICMPILDILGPSLPEGGDSAVRQDAIEKRLQRIEDRADELRFYINRLKDYAGSLSQTPTPARLDGIAEQTHALTDIDEMLTQTKV